MTDLMGWILVRQPTSPLSDFLRALGNVLHAFLYMPPRASTLAPRVDALQFWEFLFFWILGIATLGTGGWFAWHYRIRGIADAREPTPYVRAPLWFEAGAAGTLLAIFVAFWIVGYRQYVDASVAPPDAMRVYVTGKQWVWKFAYPEGPSSAGTLYVPLDRPVQLVLTSRDVIHSFFVPAFRIKQDAVPGRYTSIWFTATRLGRFQVLCAEYCGAGHSRMWGEVTVLGERDFERWLGGLEPGRATAALRTTPLTAPAATEGGARSELAERGERVAGTAGCLRCHSLDGSASLGPTWVGLWGKTVRLTDGRAVVADEAYLTRSMMDPLAEIVDGFNPIMPTYQGRLEPGDVAAILELIDSLRGGMATTADDEAVDAGASGAEP